MSTSPILPPDDDPVSFPSMPTLRGGGASRPGEPVLGRIDHYDLLRKLGGGGFGVVYLAQDSNSGVEVALKTLHPLLKTNAEEMESLREKFALVSRLSHPNIATALVLHPVRDVNIWDETARKEMRLSAGDSVMVMRYAPGVTLSRWRRQFPDGIVPLDLALDIARQIASALDYAHGERIVHRDIKPGNIMVETLGPLTGFQDGQDEQDAPGVPQNGGASRPGEPPLVTRHPSLVTSKLRVRLLDFGLAAEIRSSMSRVSSEQGDTSGTRPYMAPEQWLGKKQDGRTDQYALACVLYELLSGAPPFAGVFETGDPAIMERAVLGHVPEEIEDVPETVNAALLRALSKTPKDRFASCVEFVEALLPETRNPDIPETRTTDAGRARSPSAPQNGGASRSGAPLDAAALEADVLRRKVSLTRMFAAISDADRADSEFSPMVSETDTELTTADEAFKFGRFAAAAQCLDRAKAALDRLQRAKDQRKADAERKKREEAAQKAREEAQRRKMEAERKAREEARIRMEQEAKERAEREAREQRKREYRKWSEEEMRVLQESARLKQEQSERRVGKVLAFFALAFVGLAFGIWRAARPTQVQSRHPISTPPVLPGERGGDVLPVTVGRVTINLHWCPPGSFTMGSPTNEEGRFDNEMQHRVTLTQGFWMGETEVTQALWQEVMGRNPSSNGKGGGYPVENVSWNDCQEFLKTLNARPDVKAASLRFALPTEAQWEYACRAGTTGAYAGTGRLDDMGWYASNSGDSTHPVGQKKPNAWGLHDMHGNVYEWCADWYGAYPSGAATDPTGAASGDYRVLRGGSYWYSPQYCRSARRNGINPVDRYGRLGFRLVAFQDGKGHP